MKLEASWFRDRSIIREKYVFITEEVTPEAPRFIVSLGEIKDMFPPYLKNEVLKDFIVLERTESSFDSFKNFILKHGLFLEAYFEKHVLSKLRLIKNLWIEEKSMFFEKDKIGKLRDKYNLDVFLSEDKTPKLRVKIPRLRFLSSYNDIEYAVWAIRNIAETAVCTFISDSWTGSILITDKVKLIDSSYYKETSEAPTLNIHDSAVIDLSFLSYMSHDVTFLYGESYESICEFADAFRRTLRQKDITKIAKMLWGTVEWSIDNGNVVLEGLGNYTAIAWHYIDLATKIKPSLLICPECGNYFIPIKKNQRFCSKQCQERMKFRRYYQRHRKKKQEETGELED